MKTEKSSKRVRLQLLLLFLSAIVLIVLSFMPNSRAAISSSETRFTEISAHGLGITPASCAAAPYWYHGELPESEDHLGRKVPAYVAEYGANPFPGSYICVINTTANQYFLPARTQAEIDSFRAAGASNGMYVY